MQKKLLNRVLIMYKKLFIILVLLGLGLGYYVKTSMSEDASSSKTSVTHPPPNNNSFGQATTIVKVVSPKLQVIQEEVASLGTVIPSQSVTVTSQVSGILKEIFFEEGQPVKKGDLLAKIDPRTYQAALDKAKGSLAENQAKLNNARQDLKRYQTLYKQDSIARQEVDTQRALVKQYEGMELSLKATVEQAEVDLGYTDIVAPMDGRLGLRKVDIGNLITANSAEGIVVITQTQPIDVSFSIPETYIHQLASPFYQGIPLKVRVFNKDNTRILGEGVVVSMDNQIDTNTGSIKLKARFDNKDYQLFPNQFVNIKIVLREIQDALVLSNDAIQYNNDGAYVYVVQEDLKVKTQSLSLGVINNGYTQVLSGLSAQDKVVIEGLDRLRNGSIVEIVQ